MLRNEGPAWDRSADLEQIRGAYARYDATHRADLWSDDNPGFACLAAELRAAVVDAIRASLLHGGRVLDLGCGTGELTGAVDQASLEADWTGVDLRPEAVEQAQGRYPHARFLVASADDVPELDASYDVVVAQVLFSSLPSRALEDAVAAEVARLLRPGGWLVWSDLRYSNPTNRSVHGINRRRLSALFPRWRSEIHTAGLLPPVARRLGRTSRWSYPALRSMAPLRSHLVGRLQRPGSQGGA